MFGKTRFELESWFNESYVCTRRRGEKNAEYFWNTAGDGQWEFCKSSLNQLGRFWNDPVRVDFSTKPTGFNLLMEKIRT